MKMRFYFSLLVLLLVLANNCSANAGSFKHIKNGIEVKTQEINIKVQFYNNNIIRIVKWEHKSSDKKHSLSVILDNIPSLKIKAEQQNKFVILSSDKVKVKISLENGFVTFYDRANKDILAEDSFNFKPVVYQNDSGYSIKQNFVLSPDEGIYGLGDNQDGIINYRGKSATLVQTNTNAVNPFLISTKNYGILWDNYSKTIFEDDGKKYSSFWSDIADNIDYYFIYGSNMDNVIAGYRKLTGQAPMYGKWAYGYWQSKEHYNNRSELMSVAVKYRKLKMPIDNIIQDWDYWNGQKNWSGMFFDETLFPKSEEMIDSLHKMNYHFMISIWPALGPNTDIYKDMQERGYLYSPVGWAGFKYYDAFNPAANNLYWQYVKKGLKSKGVDGWWIDSTEPDIVNAMTRESTEFEMKKVENNYLGSWARYLNAFSLSMTSDLYKNYRNEFSDKRFYILTRSTYAGQQRNAATTWSGDIGASWEIYKKQIASGINHCMSGIPYFTFDIGAFVLGAYNGVFTNGGSDLAYQELYTRMFQLGAFNPIFRSHGSETPREMWEMEEYLDAIAKFDMLRYRLLPYIYSLAWKVTNEGYTIMRGLPMDFSIDKDVFSIDDQFMFGPSIMVCPVTEFMYNHPPEASVLIGPEYFKTNDGKQGIYAQYCKDKQHQTISHEQVEPNIDHIWYSGRPDYTTDSMFSVRWSGKLIPKETGQYQFHMKSYDAKRIYIDGKELPIVYTSVEQYTDKIELTAGKEYNLVLEMENSSTGAAKMQLFWKTPSLFAKEKVTVNKPKVRKVYLPKSTKWIDFWTGKEYNGGQTLLSDAPIEKIPLFVKAGAIIPFGPFLQYATEKPADPIELRIYPGANGNFALYEDENDNYNYEKGIYSTIEFKWNDAKRLLTIEKRKGNFPGMLKERTFKIVLVTKGISIQPNAEIKYKGERVTVKIKQNQ